MANNHRIRRRTSCDDEDIQSSMTSLRCDIKQHVEKKKKIIDIASFILALCIVLYIFDDDIDIGGRRFLRSSSRELSIYLEGPSTLLPWAEHNLIDIKDSTATPQQPPPTALFWEIPRTGARQTKELYQCYNHLTIATADTKDGISRAKGLQLARRTSTPEDEEENTSISYTNSADIIYTAEPNFAGQELFNQEHQGRYMSIFRSPIDRAMSWFYYIQNTPTHRRYRQKYGNMTLLDWASIPDEEDNYMVHKLVGKRHAESVDETDLIIAKELVRQRFVVGLMTDFDESVRRFNIVLGINEEKENGCINEFRSRGVRRLNYPKFEPGSPEYEALAAKNNLDMLLYQYIEEEVYPAQQEIINSYLEAAAQLSKEPQDLTQDSKALIVSQGAGPQLTGLDGQTIQVNGNSLWELQGATWYNAFTSSRFHWNVAPYRFDTCPSGQNMFNIRNGFTFKEEDPKIPGRMKTRYLSFQMDRRDARKCLFNGSDTCLGGGNFRMNFGKTSPNMINPGVFDVGSVRIVAYNTIPACTRRWYDSAEDINSRQQAGSTKILLENTPVDYARQVQASSIDPKKCGKWIEQRELRDDIFLFNSDLITVHVDTPWMHIIIDVEQNKVATPDECNYATMKVHIANINPGLTKEMQESFGGILSGGDLSTEAYQVDGPFGTGYIPIPEPDTVEEVDDPGIIDQQVPTSGAVEGLLEDNMLGFVA